MSLSLPELQLAYDAACKAQADLLAAYRAATLVRMVALRRLRYAQKKAQP